jgi:hypothetical protein
VRSIYRDALIAAGRAIGHLVVARAALGHARQHRVERPLENLLQHHDVSVERAEDLSDALDALRVVVMEIADVPGDDVMPGTSSCSWPKTS